MSNTMDTITTDFENWGSYLMKQFQAMYDKGERCDLEISCNKQIFLVHRLIMAACSEYVRELADKQHIILPNEVSCKAVQTIIDFIYTGKIVFCKDEKEDLLVVSNLLNMRLLTELIKMEESCSFTLSVDEDTDESKVNENTSNDLCAELTDTTESMIDEPSSEQLNASLSPTVKKKGETKSNRPRPNKNSVLPPLFKFPYLQQKLSSSRTYGLITILTEPIPSRCDIPDSILQNCAFRSSFEDISYGTEILSADENLFATLDKHHTQFLKKVREAPSQKRSYSNTLYSPFDKYTPPYNVNVDLPAPKKREHVASYLSTMTTTAESTPLRKKSALPAKPTTSTPKKSVTFAKQLEIIVDDGCSASTKKAKISSSSSSSPATTTRTGIDDQSMVCDQLPNDSMIGKGKPAVIDLLSDQEMTNVTSAMDAVVGDIDMELPPPITPVASISGDVPADFMQASFVTTGENVELTKLNNVAVSGVDEIRDSLKMAMDYEIESTSAGDLIDRNESAAVFKEEDLLVDCDDVVPMNEDRDDVQSTGPVLDAPVAVPETAQLLAEIKQSVESVNGQQQANSSMQQFASESQEVRIDRPLTENVDAQFDSSEQHESDLPAVGSEMVKTQKQEIMSSEEKKLDNLSAASDTMLTDCVVSSPTPTTAPSEAVTDTTEVVENISPSKNEAVSSQSNWLSQQSETSLPAAEQPQTSMVDVSGTAAGETSPPKADTCTSAAELPTEGRITSPPPQPQTLVEKSRSTLLLQPLQTVLPESNVASARVEELTVTSRQTPSNAALVTSEPTPISSATKLSGTSADVNVNSTNSSRVTPTTNLTTSCVTDAGTSVAALSLDTSANSVESILSDSSIFTPVDKTSVPRISTDPNSQIFALKVKGTENPAQLSKLVDLCKNNPLFKNKNVKFKIVPVKGVMPKTLQDHAQLTSGVLQKAIIVRRTENSKPDARGSKETSAIATTVSASPPAKKRGSGGALQRSLPSIENVSGPWQCKSCGDGDSAIESTAAAAAAEHASLNFDSYFDYRTHLHDVHQEPNNLMYCIYCGHKALKRHLQVYHQFVKHNIAPPSSFHFPKCDKCDFHALNDYYMQKHASNHVTNAGMEYVCACKKAFKNGELLQQHMASNECKKSNGFSCGYCNSVFTRFVNLKAHMRVCMKERAKPIS